MLNAHRGRAGVLALAAAAALAAVPVASSLAEESDAELFGVADSADVALGFDWAAPIFDVDVEQAAAEGATVTDAPCVIGTHGGTADSPELSRFLRRGVETSGQLVVTPSSSAHFVCHTDVTGVKGFRAPGQAVVVNDAPCMLPNRRRTQESQIVLTPSGQLTLVCHFTP